MRPKPAVVTFGPALEPLTQHFHISAIIAAAFTNQRTAALFDKRRHGTEKDSQGSGDPGRNVRDWHWTGVSSTASSTRRDC